MIALHKKFDLIIFLRRESTIDSLVMKLISSTLCDFSRANPSGLPSTVHKRIILRGRSMRRIS